MYKTSESISSIDNLGLAAAVSAAGHPLVNIRRVSSNKFDFIFTSTSSFLRDCESYWDGTLRVSALELENQRKNLKSRIYSQYKDKNANYELPN